MWFMLRAAFCIGLVFSMTPGVDPAAAPRFAASLASAVPAAAMRNVVDGALATCGDDPKFCLELAQRLASLEGGETLLPKARRAHAEADSLVSDTLTPSDRMAAPWRGKGVTGRQRAGGRPAT